MTIGVSSIGIKFEEFMQAGCRDQGLHLVLLKAQCSVLTKYKQIFISEKTVHTAFVNSGGNFKELIPK